jgi:hypothetical protein
MKHQAPDEAAATLRQGAVDGHGAGSAEGDVTGGDDLDVDVRVAGGADEFVGVGVGVGHPDLHASVICQLVASVVVRCRPVSSPACGARRR